MIGQKTSVYNGELALRRQPRGTFESVVSDTCGTAGDGDCVQAGAALKGGTSNAAYTLRNGNAPQGCTVPKRTGTDKFQPAGKLNFRQTCAMGKGLAAKDGDTLGQSDAGQI